MYQRWLADVSGYDTAETEVVKHVLRVDGHGRPRPPAHGEPLAVWHRSDRACHAPGNGAMTEYQPLPMPAVDACRGPSGRAASCCLSLRRLRQRRRSHALRLSRFRQQPRSPQYRLRRQLRPRRRPRRVPACASSTARGSCAPVAPAAPALDKVVEQVLSVVAAKTGYPQDMLDLDLDLEADLGIDTVKQAETFAAIRETFDIPVQEGINLRDYPTLAAVVGLRQQDRPDLADSCSQRCAAVMATAALVAAAPVAAYLLASVAAPAADLVVDKVLNVVAEKTGYPKDMLDLDLDLEADLGIDTVKQAETFAAIREAFAIPLPGRAQPPRLPDPGQRGRLRAHDAARPGRSHAGPSAQRRRPRVTHQRLCAVTALYGDPSTDR